MDQATVEQSAREYAAAMEAGEFMNAGRVLSEDARETIGPVMMAMPTPLTTAKVTDVRQEGDEYAVVIHYAGPKAEIVVESRWGERGGRPMITAMSLHTRSARE